MRGLWAVCLVAAAASAAPPPEAPSLSVDEILAKAIEVQERHEDAGHEVAFDYDLVSVTEKLDDDGEVREVEESLYRSHHIDGVAYERLVKKDGRELTGNELDEEREREKKFREKLAEGEARHNDADDRVAFDEELISRYDFDLVETRSLGRRECFVLSYVPKPGKLPIRRSVDRALNNAAGTLWIDTESFEITRLEFELQDKIRLWWGVMGSISNMTGRFDRRPTSGGIWVPERFDFYMRARMLFKSVHLRQRVTWDGFEQRRDTIASRGENNND